MKRFAGVFTPIVTPFDASDRVDESALRRNVSYWLTTPLTGLVVLGSNGEAAQLDEDESDRVVAVTRELIPRSRTLIAGTGRESTRATVAATRRAAALGVDAVIVRTPSFFKPQMTTEAFVGHYMEVANASPVPVLLYNVAMYTGVNLGSDAVERLASHPNIVGLKESGGDVGAIAEYVATTPDTFTVLAGSATTYFQALCAGCDGAVLALAALVPDACVRIRALVLEGRIESARALHRQLVPLARLVGSLHGVPGLKAALNMIGLSAGVPRPPLRPVEPAVADAIRRGLDAAGATGGHGRADLEVGFRT